MRISDWSSDVCSSDLAARQNARLSIFKPLAATLDSHEVESTLELVGLKDDANVLSADLPEGKRKLLDVAMALALRPKLLIMDEPTSGVASEDKHGLMQTVMNALKERKVTKIGRAHV